MGETYGAFTKLFRYLGLKTDFKLEHWCSLLEIELLGAKN